MILTISHLFACICLFAAALAAGRGSTKAVPFLLPLILVSTLAGIALTYPYAVEIFVAKYSGAIYEMEALTYPVEEPYWWVYCGIFFLPLLPGLPLFPAIRRQFLLVALLAVVGAIPSAFSLWQDIAFG